ncbi:F1-F0 ATPase (N-ATPase) AtpR subunit [Hoeflea marina]|uniref:F1-F0 ATPase (N-ATPase) AtpR subunit n=1 Tax=Hoeflea marina TaxID=274592 RepID=A0A317PST5_9HYPH|nr:ATP synthase subunit I [Hoeflea marina]PWW04541.1 F1-F0 ATPase (N-ATPase) AtpR subunit [Hoeflea marina]
MTHLGLPTIPVLLSWIAWLALGVSLGGFYFHMLRVSVDLLVGGSSTLRAVLFILGRFGLAGAGLALASFAGAVPLLLMAAGLFAGRQLVMRREARTS